MTCPARPPHPRAQALQCVIQEEASGCAIASVANIVGKSYAQMKAIANAQGVFASDPALWSSTDCVRRLLAHLGVGAQADETPFTSWQALPDVALLSIKHHQEGGRDFWHWVVFKRVQGQDYVLDSASYLPTNIRQDFEAMAPKWFIAIAPGQTA